MATGSKRQQSRRPSGAQRPATHRSTISLQKTEILINVYDLLPVDTPLYPDIRIVDKRALLIIRWSAGKTVVYAMGSWGLSFTFWGHH